MANAMTATPAKALNVVALPRRMRISSIWAVMQRAIAAGMLPLGVTCAQRRDAGRAWSREKDHTSRDAAVLLAMRQLNPMMITPTRRMTAPMLEPRISWKAVAMDVPPAVYPVSLYDSSPES